MPSDATSTFTNEFGTVYSDRVAFYAKKGWFSGGTLEELPLRHVTSVRLETTRNTFGGVVLCAIAFACLFYGSGGVMLFGVVLLAIGVLLLIGWPAVTINTAGNDLRTSTGGIWQKGNADAFVAAVRKALFDKP
jgi:hypothetical protein